MYSRMGLVKFVEDRKISWSIPEYIDPYIDV